MRSENQGLSRGVTGNGTTMRLLTAWFWQALWMHAMRTWT